MFVSLHYKCTATHIPRLLLAAASSDSGKTTIALGLIEAFRRRGLSVAASKVGPDFIDAAHLAQASTQPARNLDAWLATEPNVISSFVRGAYTSDIAIIEGAMGLFDGKHGSGDGSSAHIARLLSSPVVLVLDCAKSSSTIGAIAFGLAHYDPRIKIAGVILNRVASDRHASTIRDACHQAKIPVLGVLYRDECLILPSRHLGLCPPNDEAWSDAREAVTQAVCESVDLDALLVIASQAPAISYLPATALRAEHVRIAVPRDDAFWFYDEGNLEMLQDAGAEIVNYSPLRDAFPKVDAAFIGGGYPELHAEQLEANRGARNGLRCAMEAGMPTYAECGGLMYLGRTLETSGTSFEMVGAIPAISTMSSRRSALRYVEAKALGEGPLFSVGSHVRGHEFHYSKTRYDRIAPAFLLNEEQEGYLGRNVHASYLHVHLASYPKAVSRFLSRASEFAGAQ